MDEMVLAGLLVIFSALPGLAIGLLLLLGKWQPASIQAARDPARARVATARLLLGVDALLVLMGIALVLSPREHGLPIAVGGIVLVTLAALVLAAAAVKASKA